MTTVPRHLVLVGAGHVHVGVLRRFARRRLAGARITVISPDPATTYSGMVPGVVAGLYRPEQARIALMPLLHAAGAAWRRTVAVGIDSGARLVLCGDGPPERYDLLSLDIGAAPGAPDGAIAVRPVAGLPRAVAALRQRLRERRGGHVAVVGAGAGGTELMLALSVVLRRELGDAVRLSLMGPLLPGLPHGFRARVAAVLTERGVERHWGDVVAVAPGRLCLSDGAVVDADEILWATAVAPAPWLRQSGLDLDSGGFLATDAHLRVGGSDCVFAAGDCASPQPNEIAKSGVYAVRAAPVLAANIHRSLAGRPLRAFRPQRNTLLLLSTGTRHAIGTRGGLVVSGGWVWRWKDWLDRRFVTGRFIGGRFLSGPRTPSDGGPGR